MANKGLFASAIAKLLPAADTRNHEGAPAYAYDSPFEEAVAAQLEQRGWMVVPQVGISGFRIDLGIRHPDLPGAYLAGVECDGATYHSAATARDRDKVREQVLTGLGWNMLRVWSTDWWYDATGCAERLHAALNALLEASRAAHANDDIATEEEPSQGNEGVQPLDEEAAPQQAAVAAEPAPVEAERVSAEASPPVMPVRIATAMPAASVAPDLKTAAEQYRITDLTGFATDPARFFEFAYRDTLRGMVHAVIETEGPIRADILYQRIARAHGWLRTGGKIRERIDMHLGDVGRTLESSGEFIWTAGAVATVRPYRVPSSDEARRGIPEIPIAELAAVVQDNPALLKEPDPARELARLLGVERLAAGSRARLDEAIARARSVDVDSPATRVPGAA